MLEWIVTSSALILIVALLRTLLKGKISLRLQFALWTLVLLRLLIPVNLFSSNLSVMNAVPDTVPVSAPAPAAEQAAPVRQNAPAPQNPDSQQAPASQAPVQASPAPLTASDPQAAPVLPKTDSTPARKPSLGEILAILWVMGICGVAGALLYSNIVFSRRLRWARQPFETDLTKLPVYVVEGIPSPCLFGLLHPAIYLTPAVIGDETKLRHILSHEETHLRHGDNGWSLLRSVALALHWYNPLVWLAARLSRQDGELACDEDAIRRLGEEQRLSYGRTLISLVSQKQHPGDLLCCATTMSSGKRSLTERIRLLAKKPKILILPLVAVILVSVLAVGCTFTGRSAGTTPPPDAPAAGNRLSQENQKLQEQLQSLEDSLKDQDLSTIASDVGLPENTNSSGLEIPIPERYRDQLVVKYGPEEENGCYTLVTLREKASVEAYRADSPDGEDVPGLLLQIYRMPLEMGQDFVNAPPPGDWIFARDSQYYYAVHTATDVQIYRSTIASQAVAQYELAVFCELQNVLEHSITSNMIYLNNLTSLNPKDPLQKSPGLDITVPIPEEFQDLVILEERGNWRSDYGTALYGIREKKSVEENLADGGDGNCGLAYTIRAMSREEFGAYLSNGFECYFFARDPATDTYYAFSSSGGPDDYRRGGHITAEDTQEWAAIFGMKSELAENIIEANSLVPFTNDDF